MKNRVFITGMGCVNANGHNSQEFFENYKDLKSGIKIIDKFKDNDLGPAALVTDFQSKVSHPLIDASKTHNLGITFQAISEAIQQAGLDQKSIKKAALSFGVGLALSPKHLVRLCVAMPQKVNEDRFEDPNLLAYNKNLKKLNKLYQEDKESLINDFMDNSCTHIISNTKEWLQSEGNIRNITNLCVSSSQAIGEAFYDIADGMEDLVIAGGSETFSSNMCLFFHKLGIYSKSKDIEKSCIPFDINRKGLVHGEGAAYFILESEAHIKARKGQALFEINSYFSNNNLHHMVNSPPSGMGLKNCMKESIKQANLKPADIDLVVAHGTGTVVNDHSESHAISRLFDHDVLVHSNKSCLGHTYAAAGAMNLIVACLELQHQYCLPTLFLKEKDPDCPVTHVACEGESKKLDHIISNAAGFGGINASIVVSKVK
ncbi:beta-ketoacyl-[acyl-carrier-protein] synthase family protein [bacterium]|nr:beta-ketoacyl-[acyl-carrier-protein] synthase family protein [bacterium]